MKITKTEVQNKTSQDYRLKMLHFLESISKSKVSKKNDIQVQKEEVFKEQAKKMLNEGKQQLKIDEAQIKQKFKKSK